MSATIIQRVISGSNDNAVQLNSGQFGRMITLPAAWNQIRVGVRIHMTNSGGSLAGTPHLAIGFGHGTTNMIGDALCDNWIGVMTRAARWLYTAGSNYNTNTQGLGAAKKVGATITFAAANLNAGANCYFGNQAASATADRTLLFADITKGSPNYTIGGLYCSTDTPVPDISAATFLSQMIVLAPAATKHSIADVGVVIPFDEVAGALNAAQVWWDRSDALIEISDLAVAVLA